MDKEKVKLVFKAFLHDYDFNTYASSLFSVFLGVLFFSYNAFLGIRDLSIWHGSICVYYLLMALIRGLIVVSQRDANARVYGCSKRKKVILLTHFLMLLMDLSVAAPIWTMIRGDRTYSWGLVPAILIAAYTVYRITITIMNYRKSTKQDDTLVKVLRTIYMMDALFALIVLQNTMILANNGSLKGGLLVLSCATSLLLFLAIVTFSVLSFKNSMKELLSGSVIHLE